jgi:hypothetical protein
MNLVAKFVKEEMTSDERKELIADYDAYEATASTGDTLLRRKAEELNGYLNHSDAEYHITFRMNELAFECCRYYARVALELENLVKGLRS